MIHEARCLPKLLLHLLNVSHLVLDQLRHLSFKLVVQRPILLHEVFLDLPYSLVVHFPLSDHGFFGDTHLFFHRLNLNIFLHYCSSELGYRLSRLFKLLFNIGNSIHQFLFTFLLLLIKLFSFFLDFTKLLIVLFFGTFNLLFEVLTHSLNLFFVLSPQQL